MLWTILLVLVVLWALGAFVFPVAGGLIHLLLVIALVVLVVQLFTGRKVV
ncbi:MAG TPA: lmo0937 family membrane protein [Gemmatimonadales bacterium]|nr:lmo0937 family membrane protein [Gemmatimonadales bacterium]